MMFKYYVIKFVQPNTPPPHYPLNPSNNIWPENKQAIVGTTKTNGPEEIKDLADRHDPNWSTYTIGPIFPTAPQK